MSLALKNLKIETFEVKSCVVHTLMKLTKNIDISALKPTVKLRNLDHST